MFRTKQKTIRQRKIGKFVPWHIRRQCVPSQQRRLGNRAVAWVIHQILIIDAGHLRANLLWTKPHNSLTRTIIFNHPTRRCRRAVTTKHHQFNRWFCSFTTFAFTLIIIWTNRERPTEPSCTLSITREMLCEPVVIICALCFNNSFTYLRRKNIPAEFAPDCGIKLVNI